METEQTKVKIIFLDIDFVLNSHRFEISRLAQGLPYVPYFSEIDPKALSVLESIVNSDVSIRIVIHSSWREELNLSELKNIFESFSFPTAKIIAVTSRGDKSLSIERYLKENPTIAHFVVLDDDGLFNISHPIYNRFYRVPTRGLTIEDIQPILKIIQK